MKIISKIISAVIAGTLSVASVCSTVSYYPEMSAAAVELPASGTCGENLKWEMTDDTLFISGTGEMENDSTASMGVRH